MIMYFFNRKRLYQIIVAVVLKVLQLQEQITLLETQNRLLDLTIQNIILEQKEVENEIKKAEIFRNKLDDEAHHRLLVFTTITAILACK